MFYRAWVTYLPYVSNIIYVSNNQIEIELEEETVKTLQEIAEAEGNTVNEQLLKMMAVYTTSNLISKTEQLQKSLTEATQEA